MNTKELTDIECALQLLSQILIGFRDNSEPVAAPTDLGGLTTDVRVIGTRVGDDDPNLDHKRLAIRKSLQSAVDLLGVAHQLMSTPESRSTKDLAARKRAMLQDVRLAARRAYEAGHLLIGIDLATDQSADSDVVNQERR
ncbi:hypothetical protein [Variovorax sp. GT1P44]|uniref:hypothetical protein n=1 Tax=Variovorax sp. GT1P44 TaxID=3443742 RepID=UPI003F480E35